MKAFDAKGTVGLLLLTMALLLPPLTLGPVGAQTPFVNITSYRVEGAPNFTAPGTESFWNSIGWTDVPLAASVSPGGGHTSNVLLKSANDGFNFYVLFQWNDSSGPAFGASSELYTAGNGSLLPLTDESTANVTQLFYNSTYYYQDRIAMLWYVGSSDRQQSPVMQLGSNGALTGGAADIWHWQAVPTDNNPQDTDFPGGYTDPNGRALYPPDNMSFAEDDYTNMTGFYTIAGNFGVGAPNLDSYGDPFLVHVGSYFSSIEKTWTLEMVRSYTTSDSQYQVQLTNGAKYYVAFAVWNGRLGESAHIKSVSQWYTVTISDQPPPVQTTTMATVAAGNVSVNETVAVALGMLIIGVVVGLLIRPLEGRGRRRGA